MRSFLPIKGPGGRYLTNREKVALLILGLTLVLCVLTLLAGERAYLDDPSRNPVSAFVAMLCRVFGGGIVALYGIVLVWSGLIYFKGEKIADVAPLAGRLFAAAGVTIGLSGALGIGHLNSAGNLGLLVGGALGNTFGDVIGFLFMIALVGLGIHLASQGAWSALREPIPAGAAAAGAPGGFSLGLGTSESRFQGPPPMPDDGDPTSDERTLAVTQAMEEIERSQGVTIVDVAEETRPSIGEEVETAPEPHPETEEAEVQRGLLDVHENLAPAAAEAEEAEREVEEYDSTRHGLVPVPPSAANADDANEDEEEYAAAHDEEAIYDDAAVEDEAEEAYGDEEAEEEANEHVAYAGAEEEEEPYAAEAEADEGADEEDEEEAYEDELEEEDEEEAYDDELEEDVDEEEYADDELEEDVDEEEYAEDELEEDADEDEYAEEELEEEADEEPQEEAGDDVLADEEEDDEGFAESEADAEEPVDVGIAQADGCGEEPDPYARGGLLRRMPQGPPPAVESADDDEPVKYTSFDWRGRPLE